MRKNYVNQPSNWARLRVVALRLTYASHKIPRNINDRNTPRRKNKIKLVIWADPVENNPISSDKPAV